MEKKPLDLADNRTEVALFRHSKVADLASPHLEQGEVRCEMQKIAKRRHEIPGTTRTTISVQTLKRWLAAFLLHGLLGLMPALRSDYGRSRKIPLVWLDKAIALRREVPSRTARVLVEILSMQSGCPKINAHTLDKNLRQLGLTRKQIVRPKTRARRWSARHVNDLWQGDASDGIWLPDPRDPQGKKLLTKLFLWIDDVSRFVTHAEFFYDQKLPRMERTLKLAVLRRGSPGRLYVDNGNVYVARQFSAMLVELGIKLIHSRVGQPRGRGKVERIFQTLQNDFYPEVYAANLQTLSELNEALWAWLKLIYHQRLHSDTRRTPLDLYQEQIEHVRCADPTVVARAFLWRFPRKVTRNGFVSLFSNEYSVDPAWGGQTIELRCDPFDLSRVDVYRDARPIARAQVRKLSRGQCLNIEPLVPLPASEPSGISFLDSLGGA